VLARARLGDDALLAHATREQDLPQHVVDLVRASVVELLALEIDLGALARVLGTQVFRQPLGVVERARPANIVRQIAVHLGLEGRVVLGLRVGLLDLEDDGHERLGDEPSAELSEMAALVGTRAIGIERLHSHATLILLKWRSLGPRLVRHSSFLRLGGRLAVAVPPPVA